MQPDVNSVPVIRRPQTRVEASSAPSDQSSDRWSITSSLSSSSNVSSISTSQNTLDEAFEPTPDIISLRIEDVSESDFGDQNGISGYSDVDELMKSFDNMLDERESLVQEISRTLAGNQDGSRISSELVNPFDDTPDGTLSAIEVVPEPTFGDQNGIRGYADVDVLMQSFYHMLDERELLVQRISSTLAAYQGSNRASSELNNPFEPMPNETLMLVEGVSGSISGDQIDNPLDSDIDELMKSFDHMLDERESLVQKISETLGRDQDGNRECEPVNPFDHTLDETILVIEDFPAGDEHGHRGYYNRDKSVDPMEFTPHETVLLMENTYETKKDNHHEDEPVNRFFLPPNKRILQIDEVDESTIGEKDGNRGDTNIEISVDSSKHSPDETAVLMEKISEMTGEIDLSHCDYPEIEDPVDPARVLTQRDLRIQRFIFFGTVLLLNFFITSMALIAHQGKVVFTFVLFIKSKDFLSSIISPVGLACTAIHRYFYPLPPVPQQWILSLIPAYSESEEQIVKTIYSLRDNGVEPHKQVMVVILDGNPRDVRSHMTRIVCEFERPYVSLKFKRGVLRILAGFMQDVPVIVIEKVKNSGKKDSLILCHDLFNYPRDNIPLYSKLLREEIWNSILPPLTEGQDFHGFDMVFCTDADSTIHKGALLRLANALARDKDAIAACGLVLVELEPGYEWSFWNLYQQFQYTFGQYVRRRAEHFVGKVSCLPGCITMIAVREEMAGAVRKYAEPIVGYLVLHHQVQYLGTDRRLTYSMLSQGKKLRTLFVPEAVSETVAPQSLQHYLSQRRRWGSNAYFNNYFYCMGENMILISRIAAAIEVVRLTMVYYRILNTALFVKGLIEKFNFMKLLPVLVIGQLPTIWFFASILLEAELRHRAHKLAIGYCINKCISPIMSLIIFSKVAKNLGSQVWGMSGVTASSAAAPAAAADGVSTGDASAAEKGLDGKSKKKADQASIIGGDDDGPDVF